MDKQNLILFAEEHAGVCLYKVTAIKMTVGRNKSALHTWENVTTEDKISRFERVEC